MLLAGKILNEPIKWYGPFVLSDDEQVHECIQDYQQGKNGFESAVGWKSEIRKLQKRKFSV